ncbi:MAG: PDZ domain-containing protein [Polyangiaceae bacterium]
MRSFVRLPFGLVRLALSALPLFATPFAFAQKVDAPGTATGAQPDARAGAQVTIEQQGKAVALGVVLGGDGRILSSIRVNEPNEEKVPEGLSSRDVTVRYASGIKVRARVMHTNKLGLALVVPLEGRPTFGVKASSEAPTGGTMHLVKDGKDTTVALGPHPTGGTDLLVSAGGEDFKAGTPLFDGSGAVYAVALRQCTIPTAAAPKSTCNIEFAPVPLIRAFLSKTPPTATIPSAWLGIGGESIDTGAVRGVRVIAVAPNSPAAAAGLLAAQELEKTDVILSVDGEAVASPEALGAKIAAHGVGDKAKLLVFRGNRLRDVVVVLKSAP